MIKEKRVNNSSAQFDSIKVEYNKANKRHLQKNKAGAKFFMGKKKDWKKDLQISCLQVEINWINTLFKAHNKIFIVVFYNR